MPTKTDPRESFHGEEEETPLFGPGSGRDDIAVGDPSDPRGPKYLSPRDLADAESAGGIGNTGRSDDKEAAAGKIPFNQADKLLPLQARIAGKLAGLFKTKKGKAGLATGGIVGGLIFIASIGQGPFMLMQLGQILMKPEFGNEKNSSIHFMRMMRYAKTGDFGETRVGYLRSKLKDKYIAEFNRAGVGFEQTALGRPSKMTFDTRNSEFSDTKDFTKQEFASKVLELPDEYVDEVTISRRGAEWTAEFDATKSKGIEYMEKSVVSISKKIGRENISSGSIGSNLRSRVLKKYFGLPGMFSPISKKFSSAAERASSLQQARAAEKERGSPRAEKIKELSANARKGLRDKMDAKKQVAASLTLGAAAGACLIHESADDAAAFNYRVIVGASALEAVDKQAVGSQVQSGVDNEGDPLSAKGVGVIQQSLIDDNGKSVFAAKGLDALARNGKGAKGEDIPNEYQQAFSQTTTADNIRDGTQKEVAGVDVTSIVCGWPGQIAGGAFSLALLLAGPPSGGAAWALFVGKTSAGVAAGVGAGILISKLLETDLSVEPPLAGALGGNLLAYGSRASANMNSIAAGGVQLGDTDAAALLKEQDEIESQEFRSKPFFARMFDLYDYRSLASASLRGYNPSISGNMSTFSSLLSSPLDLFSSLMPKAYAQEEVYDWGGQSVFGLPNEVLEDPRLQDPYENDLETTKILNGPSGSGYVEKAKKCFGAEISKGAQGWDVKTVEEAVPNSSEYTKAKCNDIDDINWRRTMLFVFQTKDAAALACYEGLDEEACAEITGENQSDESADSADISGSAKELAKKLLDGGKYSCDNSMDCEDLEMTVRGESIKGGVGCVADKLDIRVLKLLVYLTEVKGYKIGTYALCRSHSYNTGAHPQGKGLDISSIDGVSLAKASAKEKTLEVDKIIFGISGELKARQIITGGVGATGSVDSDFVRYNRCGPGIEGRSAVSCFGQDTMEGHTDHIHVGY